MATILLPIRGRNDPRYLEHPQSSEQVLDRIVEVQILISDNRSGFYKVMPIEPDSVITLGGNVITHWMDGLHYLDMIAMYLSYDDKCRAWNNIRNQARGHEVNYVFLWYYLLSLVNFTRYSKLIETKIASNILNNFEACMRSEGIVPYGLISYNPYVLKKIFNETRVDRPLGIPCIGSQLQSHQLWYSGTPPKNGLSFRHIGQSADHINYIPFGLCNWYNDEFGILLYNEEVIIIQAWAKVALRMISMMKGFSDPTKFQYAKHIHQWFDFPVEIDDVWTQLTSNMSKILYVDLVNSSFLCEVSDLMYRVFTTETYGFSLIHLERIIFYTKDCDVPKFQLSNPYKDVFEAGGFTIPKLPSKNI